jgi:glycolate oxidase FAD binding subunit
MAAESTTAVPVTTERPRTVAEAAQVLRDTTGPLLFRGGATQLDWAGRVADTDLVLDTTQLAGVLTHEPADMTASVRAGTTLTALQEHLGRHGQWLALDPPTADAGATIGGLLAAGDSGPSRLRYGGLRDLVIGVTLVLSDGTVAHSGGHVIKNVAGYDLAKLVHGSLGALALVAEVVVRLHPRPATSVTATGAADARQATAAALALAAGPLEPAAVEWVSDGGSGRLHVRFDGTPEPVAAAHRALAELLAGLGVDTAVLDDADADAAWRAHAAAVVGTEGETVVRVTGRPTDLTSLADDVAAAADRADLEVRLVSGAALGMHTVALRGGTPEGHAQTLTAVRDRALARGDAVLLRRRAPELDALVDALGPPPSTVDLMRRVRAGLDPAGRCGPGRFRPWF